MDTNPTAQAGLALPACLRAAFHPAGRQQQMAEKSLRRGRQCSCDPSFSSEVACQCSRVAARVLSPSVASAAAIDRAAGRKLAVAGLPRYRSRMLDILGSYFVARLWLFRTTESPGGRFDCAVPSRPDASSKASFYARNVTCSPTRGERALERGRRWRIENEPLRGPASRPAMTGGRQSCPLRRCR